MKRIFFYSVVAGMLLIAPLHRNCRAEIYQYVDDAGVVHFTNVPGPKIAHAGRVKIRSEAAAAKHRASNESDGVPVAYLEMINNACVKFGVDPSLVHAIVKVESDFNPFALSRKGAMGLMQLMPQTASDLNVKNSFSPGENIEGGVKYLRYLLDRYEGNLKLAIAAYNSGETAVKRWGTVPPFKETRDYVRKVLALYEGNGGSGGHAAQRYTIFVSYGPDGSLLLTDNPAAHPDRQLIRRPANNL